MSATTSLVLALIIAAIIVCATAVWALIEVAKTARATREAASELHARLMPLLEKADVTVDAVNAELYRIDGIITRFETAGERVDAVSDTVSGIVNTPAELVNEFAGRMRRAFKDRRRASEATAAAGSDARDVSAPEPPGEESVRVGTPHSSASVSEER